MPSEFTFTTAHKVQFGAQVLAAPWMQALMLAQAEKGAEYARSIAPRRTGEYAESIEADVYVRTISNLDTPGPGRAVGRVTAGTDHAAIVEHGDGVRPGHRVLGRSLGAMGML